MTKLPNGVSWRRFFSDLLGEIRDDNVTNGAAALAYYLTLAIFPALVALLSVLPFLPMENLDQAVLALLRQVLPEEAAGLLTGTVGELISDRRGGLLSAGLLGALWAASAGTYAVMQQLNITYDVREQRSFLKVRAVAVGLTFGLGLLIVVAFALIILGGDLQEWLAKSVGWSGPLVTVFALLRWLIIIGALLLAFAAAYYFGPNVQQRFRFITPGSVLGTLFLMGATLLFQLYVANFGNYDAMYGGLGAVVVLMLWLYVVGAVILLGSEVNALIEHYSPAGKEKGERREPASKDVAA